MNSLTFQPWVQIIQMLERLVPPVCSELRDADSCHRYSLWEPSETAFVVGVVDVVVDVDVVAAVVVVVVVVAVDDVDDFDVGVGVVDVDVVVEWMVAAIEHFELEHDEGAAGSVQTARLDEDAGVAARFAVD